MRSSTLLFGVLLLLVLVVTVNSKRGGGGRGGGGRSGGRVGGRTGGYSRGRSGWSGGKKSSVKSKLKKAAVIGAVAYGSYQLGKATARFAHWSHTGWGFSDWDRWRQQDGHLCRNNNDCTWLDRNLQCEDYELDFSPMRAWYGGDFAAIVGQCDCQGGMVWDNYELQCQVPRFGGTMVALVIVLVLGVLGCCCCGFLCWFCRR